MYKICIEKPEWMPGGYVDVINGKNIDCIKGLEFRFPRSARQILRKRKPILPSMHAEKYRVVTESAIPGPWQNIVTPYLIDIMDAADYPSVLTLILCKCVQSGGSEAAHNFIGYSVDRKPGPVMYVYPTMDAGKKQLKKRILTMFKASPHLKRYLTGAVNDETNMEIKLKHLTISIAWAHSATSLASDPMCYVVFDETDKYPAAAAKTESDPISLGEKRTTTFRRRRKAKIWKLSTPTTFNGPISVSLREEAQVVFDYYVQCPECGQFQKMIFKRIKWAGGSDADPEKIEAEYLAWYKCEFCSGKWDDEKRNRSVRSGHWRSRGDHQLTVKKYLETYNPKKVGFHLPAWISYFVSLSESAAASLRSRNSRTKLKDFLNNYAAEPWKEYEVIANKNEEEILKCRSDIAPQTIPESVVALTAGIDVQKTGFWYVVRAWAKDWTSWNIDHGFLGNWTDVEKLLFENVYPVPDSDRVL
ncbi:MAG: terminase, partial [Deltaproteobacteria bacterium]|nr:terminase [Deltaproteobacteria bacterium]